MIITCVAINSVGHGHNCLLESNSYPGFRGRPTSLYFQMTIAKGESRPNTCLSQTPENSHHRVLQTTKARTSLRTHAFVIRLFDSLS